MSLYDSAVSFSKTLICFPGFIIMSRQRGLRARHAVTSMLQSASTARSGVSGHTVKHAEGSGHSRMHLPKDPARTASWTRLCCKKKKMDHLRAFSNDDICTDAQNCNLPHKKKYVSLQPWPEPKPCYFKRRKGNVGLYPALGNCSLSI